MHRKQKIKTWISHGIGQSTKNDFSVVQLSSSTLNKMSNVMNYVWKSINVPENKKLSKDIRI